MEDPPGQKQQSKSGIDVKQAAIDWEERGVYTVPLHEGTKRPRGKNWQHLRLVSDEFGKAFRLGDNLGGLWGEPSNWATDFDLDLSTAPLVAEHILEEYPTFIYGRLGKEWSHYIFRCVGAVTKKWQIQGKDELGMVVEIRSTGAQSVLPPSKHPEGGRYFIHVDEFFFEIVKRDLEALGDEIAIASVFLYFYPEKGAHGRHDYVHACTGALCHAKWKRDKIIRVMQAVLREVADEDEEIKDRMGSVVNTIQHAEDDDHIKGLTSLEEFTTRKTVLALRQWLKAGTREHQIELTPKKTLAPKKKQLDFKSDWLNVPGLIGDIAKWCNKRSYIQQPVFDLATGLICTAYASSNKYVVQTWDTPISPYCMVTAPTGGGKGSVLSAITEFSEKCGMLLPFQGFQSYYALLDTLAEEGSICLLWDEAARNLAASKNINGPDFQTITHIIRLYGQGNGVVGSTPGRKKEIPDLIHPFLVLLATAQPDMLMESLTSTAQETGVVNRFLLFDTGERMPPLNRHRSKVFPSAIKRQGRLLMQHEVSDGDFTEVEFATTRTYNRFQEFEEAARQRSMRKEFTWSRANQNALILAGTAAVGIDPFKPVIEDDLANWAMEIVRWSCDCWEEKIRLTGAGTLTEQQSKIVERMIRQPESFFNLANQPAQHKQLGLLKRGFMHPSVLARGTRSIPKYRLSEILDSLHDAELIGSTDQDGVTCYFSKD